MTTRNKRIATTLLALLLVLALGACGAPAAQAPASEAAPAAGGEAAAPATEGEAAAPAEGGRTFRVWWYENGNGMDIAWKDALADFQAAHPDVTVEFELKTFQQMEQTARMVLNSNDVPDVMEINKGNATAGLYSSEGLLTNLDEVAAERGWELPAEADSAALEQFLVAERRRDPERFPDLSLTIVKLLGRGEYVVEVPGGPRIGHFGLAVRDYSHSTAPNRRFPDLITGRLLKAALTDARPPYSHAELERLAVHCTRQEDAANKVERQLRKSEAALLLEQRIGDVFDGVVTGVSKGNNWVRVFSPPAEGKLAVGRGGAVKVGDKVRVKLLSTNVERGFIDFGLMA